MPRGKKNQYALAQDGNGNLTPVRVDGGGDGVPAVSGVQTQQARQVAALEALGGLDTRTDGWVRLIPSGDGKQGYAKWKFTRGRWRGRYVMWAYPAGDIIGGILGLSIKLEMVDSGELTPSYDQYGGDGWAS